jgi:hypothetical protein
MMKKFMWSIIFEDKSVLEKKIVRNYKMNLLGGELVNSFQQERRSLVKQLCEFIQSTGIEYGFLKRMCQSTTKKFKSTK